MLEEIRKMNSPKQRLTWEELQKIKASQAAAAKERPKKLVCERQSDECSGDTTVAVNGERAPLS